jgi:small subunit ribosomal protein S8
MSLTDPIANYLTLIRNAIQAKHQKVDIPSSKLLVEITKLLKDEGYITNLGWTKEKVSSANLSDIVAKNAVRTPVFQPGCRVYTKKKIPVLLGEWHEP